MFVCTVWSIHLDQGPWATFTAQSGKIPNLLSIGSQRKQRYNTIYSTPTIARETLMAAPTTEEHTTVPTQVTAGESSAQRPRRSGRSRRPPSRYVPEAPCCTKEWPTIINTDQESFGTRCKLYSME